MKSGVKDSFSLGGWVFPATTGTCPQASIVIEAHANIAVIDPVVSADFLQISGDNNLHIVAWDANAILDTIGGRDIPDRPLVLNIIIEATDVEIQGYQIRATASAQLSDGRTIMEEYRTCLCSSFEPGIPLSFVRTR